MTIKVFFITEGCIIVVKLGGNYNEKNNKVDILSELMYYNRYE